MIGDNCECGKVEFAGNLNLLKYKKLSVRIVEVSKVVQCCSENSKASER